MKVIIDIRFLRPDSPTYACFTSDLIKSILQANQEDEWIVVGRKKEPIFEKDFSVIYLKSGLFKWIEGGILLRFLKQQRSLFYIKVINYGWEIYKASNDTFTKKNLKQAVSRVDFLPMAGAQHVNNNVLSQSLYPALPDAFDALSWAEAQSVKTQYSGGKDYFIFAGDIGEQHRLIDLLKAFSIFKKWQQSNMLLVIAGRTTTYISLLEAQLTTYKYRQDVVIIKNPTMEDQARLVATAYALVHPASINSWPQPLVLAVKHKVAIIASDIPENRIITDAAVWVNNNDLINGFSAAMQLLYKDEQQKQAMMYKMNLTKKNNSYSALIAQIEKSLISQ